MLDTQNALRTLGPSQSAAQLRRTHCLTAGGCWRPCPPTPPPTPTAGSCWLRHSLASFVCTSTASGADASQAIRLGAAVSCTKGLPRALAPQPRHSTPRRGGRTGRSSTAPKPKQPRVLGAAAAAAAAAGTALLPCCRRRHRGSLANGRGELCSRRGGCVEDCVDSTCLVNRLCRLELRVAAAQYVGQAGRVKLLAPAVIQQTGAHCALHPRRQLLLPPSLPLLLLPEAPQHCSTRIAGCTAQGEGSRPCHWQADALSPCCCCLWVDAAAMPPLLQRCAEPAVNDRVTIALTQRPPALQDSTRGFKQESARRASSLLHSNLCGTAQL